MLPIFPISHGILLFSCTLSLASSDSTVSAQSQTPDDISYEFVTTIKNDGSELTTSRKSITGQFLARGKNMRWNYPDDPENSGHKDVYMLVNEAGKNTYYVNTRFRHFYELAEGEFEERGSVMERGKSFKIRDLNISMERLGKGPELGGYPTIEFRMTQSMSIVLSRFPRRVTVKEVSNVIFYIAPALKGYGAVSNHPRWFEFPFKGLGPDYDKVLDSVIKQIAAEGRIVKMDWTSTIKAPKDVVQSIHFTFAAKNISIEPLGDSLFIIPESYRKREPMPSKPQGRRP